MAQPFDRGLGVIFSGTGDASDATLRLLFRSAGAPGNSRRDEQQGGPDTHLLISRAAVRRKLLRLEAHDVLLAGSVDDGLDVACQTVGVPDNGQDEEACVTEDMFLEVVRVLRAWASGAPVPSSGCNREEATNPLRRIRQEASHSLSPARIGHSRGGASVWGRWADGHRAATVSSSHPSMMFSPAVKRSLFGPKASAHRAAALGHSWAVGHIPPVAHVDPTGGHHFGSTAYGTLCLGLGEAQHSFAGESRPADHAHSMFNTRPTVGELSRNLEVAMTPSSDVSPVISGKLPETLEFYSSIGYATHTEKLEISMPVPAMNAPGCLTHEVRASRAAPPATGRKSVVDHATLRAVRPAGSRTTSVPSPPRESAAFAPSSPRKPRLIDMAANGVAPTVAAVAGPNPRDQAHVALACIDLDIRAPNAKSDAIRDAWQRAENSGISESDILAYTHGNSPGVSGLDHRGMFGHAHPSPFVNHDVVELDAALASLGLPTQSRTPARGEEGGRYNYEGQGLTPRQTRAERAGGRADDLSSLCTSERARLAGHAALPAPAWRRASALLEAGVPWHPAVVLRGSEGLATGHPPPQAAPLARRGPQGSRPNRGYRRTAR